MLVCAYCSVWQFKVIKYYESQIQRKGETIFLIIKNKDSKTWKDVYKKNIENSFSNDWVKIK
jgi:hypothetical protein